MSLPPRGGAAYRVRGRGLANYPGAFGRISGDARACEIAGVEPKFQKINGQEQKAILSVNINRRHMNAAQRAMAS